MELRSGSSRRLPPLAIVLIASLLLLVVGEAALIVFGFQLLGQFDRQQTRDERAVTSLTNSLILKLSSGQLLDDTSTVTAEQLDLGRTRVTGARAVTIGVGRPNFPSQTSDYVVFVELLRDDSTAGEIRTVRWSDLDSAWQVDWKNSTLFRP